jgi:hypothetical protein
MWVNLGGNGNVDGIVDGIVDGDGNGNGDGTGDGNGGTAPASSGEFIMSCDGLDGDTFIWDFLIQCLRSELMQRRSIG